MLKKKWLVRQASDEALRIASQFKIHPAIASVLAHRGMLEDAKISAFLNPSLASLQSPFQFSAMAKSVERIRSAISKKEKIVVYGDYDVDGITGCAVLYPVLKKMGAEIEVYIPDRVKEGYGLNQEAIEALLKKKFKLLITVDNGITGIETIQFLKEKGVDTIVVDHHLPKEGALPPAFAIIGLSDEGGADTNLAACGLAFKLAWALVGDFKEVESLLDIVVLGTVADLAPVVGDNRIILLHGLPILSKTKRPGLAALMKIAQISKNYLNYRDIAFGLGPRINAAGRMGSALNAFKLLVTDNPLEAENLAQLLDEGNKDRQRIEAQAFDEALERVETELLLQKDRVLVLESEDWHEGVLGIVASRLVERYQRPAIVISLKNGLGKGSGRSTSHLSLFDIISQCDSMLESFGGHSQACGLSIRRENIALFRNKLNQFAWKTIAEDAFLPELAIDAEIELSEITTSFIRSLGQLAPFGPGNPKPLFLSKKVSQRSEAKKRGKDTLHFWVEDQAKKVACEVVGFRFYDRWQASQRNESFDIVYQPTLKDFGGISSIELQLEDWR